MTEAPARRRVPAWRIALGCAILALVAFLCIRLAPVYFHNLGLQRYVADLTQGAESRDLSDDALRTRVLQKALELELPVTADNVRVKRSPEDLRIDVRYVVRVDLPLYTVDLHFYPGAGSR